MKDGIDECAIKKRLDISYINSSIIDKLEKTYNISLHCYNCNGQDTECSGHPDNENYYMNKILF